MNDIDETRALTESALEQQKIFDEALDVFIERNGNYRDTWKQYGALSQLVRGAQKVDRLMAVWWHAENPDALKPAAIDDAIDAINHLVFFIRCARDANFYGEAPERPDPDDRIDIVNSGGEVVHTIRPRRPAMIQTVNNDGLVVLRSVEDYPL